MRSVTTCDICGDSVVIPPGVYYRGMKGHANCLKSLQQSDITNEQVSPLKEKIRAEVERSIDI